MKKKGVSWDTDKDELLHNGQHLCFIQDQEDQSVLEYHPLSRNLAACSSSRTNKPTAEKLWHNRLGHPSPKALNQLLPEAEGPKTTECETCALSKAHRIVSRKPTERADTPFSRVHLDFMPYEPAYNKDQWVAHFLDDCTKMNFVYTLPAKRLFVDVIREFTQFVGLNYQPIKTLRIDNERSLGTNFDIFTQTKGIAVEYSAPYTPEQNGAAERSGGVITAKARCIRTHADLPTTLWPEAVKTAGYLLNRTPTKVLGWKTPTQALREAQKALKKQNKPIRFDPQPYAAAVASDPASWASGDTSNSQLDEIKHLRVYGCRAYPLIPSIKIRKKDKLSPRARIGYLVGYDSTNIFRIWIPSKERVIRSRDVLFNEDLLYKDGTEQHKRKEEENPDLQLIKIAEVQDEVTTAPSEDSDEEEVSPPPSQHVGNTSTNEEVHESLPPAEESTLPSLPPHPSLPTPEDTPDPPERSTRDQSKSTSDITTANIIEGKRLKRPTARRQEYLSSVTAIN